MTDEQVRAITDALWDFETLGSIIRELETCPDDEVNRKVRDARGLWEAVNGKLERAGY